MRNESVALVVLLALGCQSHEERLAETRERAQAYFDNEQWAEAKIEYLNLLQLDPDDADAHHQLAETHWALEEHGESLWQYREAVRLAPDELDWRLKLAGIELMAKRRDEALEQVKRILESDPERVDALVLRARIREAKKEIDTALEDLELALRVDPENTAALILKARMLANQKDVVGAEQTLRRLVEVSPKSGSYVFLGNFLARTDRPEEAIEAYRKSVEVAEDADQRRYARISLANYYLSQGERDAVEEILLAEQKDSPDSEEVRQALVRFYIATDQRDEAEKVLELDAAANPDQVSPLLVLAEFQHNSEAHDRAFETVQRALDLDPENESARVLYAAFLLAREDEDPAAGQEGRRIVAEVLEKNPDSVGGMFTEAKILLADGKYEDAAARLRAVLEEQPNASTHLLLAQTYVQLGQDDLARGELLRALQLDPSDRVARTQLAALYLRTGNRELAVQEARTALTLRPRGPQLLLILAEALVGQRKNEEALEALDKLPLEREQLADRFRLQASRLYLDLGKVDKAREIVEELLDDKPDDERALAGLVIIEGRGGTPAKALTRLDAAIEAAPERAVLYELRAQLRLGFRNQEDGSVLFPEEVERDARTALEKDPSSSRAHLILGQLFEFTGRTEEALAGYREAARLDPENSRALMRLGTLAELQGLIPEAMQSYERLIELGEQGKLDDRITAVAKNNTAWLLANAETPDPADLDRALELAQDARELRPSDPSIADTLGWVMFKREIHGAAITLFREAISNYRAGSPARAVARYHLALSHEASGSAEEAIRELRLCLQESESFPGRAAAEAALQRLETAS